MKKLLYILLSASITALMTSCGSDDDKDKTDYTLYDKSEILGSQNGKVNISLSLGDYDSYEDYDAKTHFIAHTSNNSQLNLYILSPEEIGGPIVTSNFKKSMDDTYYTFDFATIGTIEKQGNEIPEYINDWFASSNPSKIIIKNMTSADARYDKSTKEISFKLTGNLEVYTKDAQGNDSRLNENRIIFEFRELKK